MLSSRRPRLCAVAAPAGRRSEALQPDGLDGRARCVSVTTMMLDDPHDQMLFRYPEELQADELEAARGWPALFAAVSAAAVLVLLAA